MALDTAYTGGKLHQIPKRGVKAFQAKIRDATLGQTLRILQLLSPVYRYRNGKWYFVSYAAGDELPDGFDPRTVATAAFMEALTRHLDPTTFITGDCRWDPFANPKEEDEDYPCEKEEGDALAKVYNIIAAFNYVTNGEISFYNLGGVSTKIETRLANKLDDTFFHYNLRRGYHVSIASYLCKGFGTFENGAKKMTDFVRDLTIKLGIPHHLADLVEDNRFPMIIDLSRMEVFKRIWWNGLLAWEKAGHDNGYKDALVGFLCTQLQQGKGQVCVFSDKGNAIAGIEIAQSYVKNNLADFKAKHPDEITCAEDVTLRQAHSLMSERGGETTSEMRKAANEAFNKLVYQNNKNVSPEQKEAEAYRVICVRMSLKHAHLLNYHKKKVYKTMESQNIGLAGYKKNATSNERTANGKEAYKTMEIRGNGLARYKKNATSNERTANSNTGWDTRTVKGNRSQGYNTCKERGIGLAGYLKNSTSDIRAEMARKSALSQTGKEPPKWTDDEADTLRKIYKNAGEYGCIGRKANSVNWEIASQHIQGKTAAQCRIKAASLKKSDARALKRNLKKVT